jgi:hypothetical protein
VRAVSIRTLLGFGMLASSPVALAQTPPGPSPTPSASATPTPAASATPRPLGVRFSNAFSTTFIVQNTVGPGQVGPEAAGFIAGSPLSPNTPYDLFSSAPLTPGIAGIGALVSTVTYRTPMLDASVTAAVGVVSGSITNAAYWGESLMPTLNPHLGSQALPYAIAFPTHPGQDDGTGVRLSILGAGLATADGSLALKVGAFDLTQTNRFVFAQPALTSVNPAIAYAPAESLSSGLAGTDTWQPASTVLPLVGVDVVAKRGIATLELTNAALPSLPGTSARATIGTLTLDHGEGTSYSLQLLHLSTAGAPFGTTVPFGANPQFLLSPQGTLPTSTLSGQQQSIVGLHAAAHLVRAWRIDTVVDLARAWYSAQDVALPGTAGPGGYAHLGLSTTFGRATATLDLFRMDARYATIILPYGVPENQWSASFAWPGQWLKSNFQLIDNSTLGVNRQGYRARLFVDKGPFEWHAEYTDLRQIDLETTVTSQYTGFVDGYYLPQLPANATLGRQQRYALWLAWHPRFGDLTADVVNDQLSRPALVPTDRVSYGVPQVVVTFSRHFSPAVVGAVGAGRYAMIGTFSQPIDFAQRLWFAGVVVKQSPQASALLTFRRTTFDGITTAPGSTVPPSFTGSLVLFEQRFAF